MLFTDTHILLEFIYLLQQNILVYLCRNSVYKNIFWNVVKISAG